MWKRRASIASRADTKMVVNDRELAREKAWSRIHTIPLLMAESDRDTYRRHVAMLNREKDIMKDVEGWEVSTPYQCDSEAGTDHPNFAANRLASQCTTQSATHLRTSRSSKQVLYLTKSNAETILRLCMLTCPPELLCCCRLGARSPSTHDLFGT